MAYEGGHPSEYELRQEMVRIGRLMWEQGFVAATDGNLSARMGPARLLATPSGLSKGFLSADDPVVIRPDGELLPAYRGRGRRPSSEILMHLEVYRQRPDVQAIVHAHPPVATAFSIAGVSLARCVLPEVVVTLGGIPTASYATPGTPEVPDSISLVIQEYDAVVLAHHGTLTVGDSLWAAYQLLERVEQTAKITLAAQQLGRVNPLPPDAVSRLAEKRREWLERRGRPLCEGCTACALGSTGQQDLGRA
jgi:L-fuculose-phosphate aldolase